MADLTASGSNPAVIWDDTDTPSTDWKMQSGSGPIALKAGASLDTMFIWRYGTGASHTSYKNFQIQTDEPILTFDDTDGATSDARIRVNANAFFFENNATGSTTWTSVLQTDSDYVFVNKGIASGSTSRLQVITWQAFTGALGSTSPCTVDVTFAGRDRQIVGALVMITHAELDDTDATYMLYDYRHTEATSDRYYSKVNRGTASNTDEVEIYFDTAEYSSTCRYKVLAFWL